MVGVSGGGQKAHVEKVYVPFLPLKEIIFTCAGNPASLTSLQKQRCTQARRELSSKDFSQHLPVQSLHHLMSPDIRARHMTSRAPRALTERACEVPRIILQSKAFTCISPHICESPNPIPTHTHTHTHTRTHTHTPFYCGEEGWG